jgi:hypothetical protein
MHFVRNADRPQGIILVGYGVSEDSHHRIPDELFDRASMSLDARAHLGKVPTHDVSQGFGVETFTEGG